jgi:hypothetical protein
VARATEAECQRTVVEAARLGGWLIYHNRPAQNGAGRWRTALQGDQGFPDLVLVHAMARLVWFIELKRKPNTLAPPQLAWADALRAAGAEYRLVWVPDELDEFCQLLANAGQPNRTPPLAHLRDPLLFDQEKV